MGEEPPQPDDPASDHTSALHKRLSRSSESSVTAESLRSTRTLQFEDVEFVHENGRIYGNDSYFMPCDQEEQDRLAIQHQVYMLALKGKLTTVKVTPATKRILDLGAGPGYWAVAMAQSYPHAQVFGIDMVVWDVDTAEAGAEEGLVTWELDDLDVWGLEDEVDDITLRLGRYDIDRDHANRKPLDSSVKQRPKASSISHPPNHPQPPAEPAPNLYVLEPTEVPGWHFSDTYDFIHLRSMKGAFSHWESVYEEIYRNLSPGGWIEVADFDLDLPNIPEMPSIDDYPLRSFAKMYVGAMQAAFKSGRPIGTYYLHPTYLKDAGFKDVSTTYVNVPIGQWPEDEEQKKIGKLFLVCLMEVIEASVLRLLTTWGDAHKIWTVEEVRETAEKAKTEVLEWGRGPDRQRHEGSEGWCANFKWIVGRKPRD